jgi:Tol biopolymer transport system component
MNETEIRERLLDLAADAPQGFRAPPRLLRRARRRVAVVVATSAAIAIAIVFGGIAGARWLGASDRQPAAPPPPAQPELRGDGEVIIFERLGTGPGWDLAAQDPETGEVRKIVETQGIIECPDRAGCRNFVKSAEWSSDGRWVAFDVSFASIDRLPHGPCGPTAGVWVKNALGDARQLTTPCDAPPPSPPGSDNHIEELWAWSPVGAQLAYARVDGETDELFVIDPSDGRRTALGTADDLTALEWSADGTRIAYADGGSVYEIRVDGGDRSFLADSFEDVVNIEWSPDGTQIMVLDRGRYRLQVMNADGSNVHVLLDGEDACCGPAWSPDGTRIAYLISRPWGSEGRYDTEIWTIAPDGSNRIKIFDSNRCDTLDAEPVWAPNGQVAYNACNRWVVGNADGTGEAQPIDQLLYRSWSGGGLSGWDLLPLLFPGG